MSAFSSPVKKSPITSARNSVNIIQAQAQHPILYSFRRCPFAMRARMGLFSSELVCELREVVLRDKPQTMLDLSPKGTVPVLQTLEGQVIDQSLDILIWALKQNDPQDWLSGDLEDMLSLITQNDQDFKTHLDHYKYSARFEDADPLHSRAQGEVFLSVLEKRLSATPYLYGEAPRLADIAIFPFIRQFANVDSDWFASTSYVAVQKWLSGFLSSALFKAIMVKYPQWQSGQTVITFK